jgi:hypothetical protein
MFLCNYQAQPNEIMIYMLGIQNTPPLPNVTMKQITSEIIPFNKNFHETLNINVR